MIEAEINIKDKVKEELIKIADTLINSAYVDEEGMKWPVGERKGRFNQSRTYDIYSGNAGIILFFIEAYKLYKDERYLDVIKKAKNAMLALCQKDKSYNYSFYKGKGGVLYTLLKIYRLTEDKGLLDIVQEMINEDFKAFIESKYVNDSLYEGRAGLLLVLNYLYQQFQSEEILDLIYETFEKLISNIKMAENGIYWEYDDLCAQQPIGFAYGTSGIVYTLMEMRNILGDKYLPLLVEQTELYENQFWSKEENSWLISNEGISNYDDFLRYKKKYNDGELEVFSNKRNDISFINGSTGIVLSKLKANQFVNDKNVEGDKNIIIEELLASCKQEDISVAIGRSGLLNFLLENALVSNSFHLKEQLVKLMDEISSKLDINNKEIDHAFGMLEGQVGIGYVLLKFLSPNIDSVLFPNPGSGKCFDNLEPIEIVDVKEYVLAYNFSRLYCFLDKTIPDVANNYLKQNLFSINSYFQFLSDYSKNTKFEERFEDLLGFENQYLTIKKNSFNKLLQFILNERKNDEIERVLNLSKEEILNIKVEFNNKVIEHVSKWNWSDYDKALKVRANKSYQLLLDSNWKYTLSRDIEIEVLSTFRKPIKVTDGFDKKDETFKLSVVFDFIYKGILWSNFS